MTNITPLFLALVLGIVATPGHAHAHWFSEGHHVESLEKAKVSMIEAIQKATEVQGGGVINAELDDYGREGVFYRIDIIKDGERHEMHVDAVTGEVTLDQDGWFR